MQPCRDPSVGCPYEATFSTVRKSMILDKTHALAPELSTPWVRPR